MSKPLPSQERLKELLSYDPSTGILTWKSRPSSWFSSNNRANAWNARWANQPACANLHKTTGYLRGTIDGSIYLTHRIIWKLMEGVDPDFVDHLDGTITNNRWTNLSNGSSSQNSRNQKLSSRNSSGTYGVSWCATTNKWLVQIGTDTGQKTIGLFNDKRDAITARKGIERILGYAARHGT